MQVFVADRVDTAGLVAQPWIDDELVAALPGRGKRQWPPALRFADLLDRPLVGLSAQSGLSRFLARQAARSGRVLQEVACPFDLRKDHGVIC